MARNAEIAEEKRPAKAHRTQGKCKGKMRWRGANRGGAEVAEKIAKEE
jgi:hypothetical protein